MMRRRDSRDRSHHSGAHNPRVHTVRIRWRVCSPAEPVVDPQQETDDTSSTLAATLFGAGGLLLAGVSAEALRRLRRRQLRHRRPGRAITATPAPLALAERAVTAGVGVVDVRWLNEALRGLVHQQAHDPDGALPDVLAARLSPVQLEFVLATARPQAPREQWPSS